MQVGFDLEIRGEGKGDALAFLERAAEFALQRGFGEISNMCGHARHGEALGRLRALDLIGAAAPVGIGHDRLAADLVEGDVLGGVARGGGDRHGADHAVGKERGPLQHLHPAHRAAGDAEHLIDAQRVEQHRLGAHHVLHGDEREVEAVGLPRRGIGIGGTGRAHAATDDIGADDKETIGIDRAAGDQPSAATSPVCR